MELINPDWQRWATWIILAAAPVTLIALVFISAPYGRHGRGGWGPVLPGRFGWLLMESPTVLIFPLVFFAGSQRLEAAPLILFACWMFHYVHRTLVFPFRLRAVKPWPLLLVFFALVFQTLNSYANGAWLGELGSYGQAWLSDPRFLIGMALFVAGEAINLQADTILINLRKPGETGYKIPRGGMYRYVTAANYFGELLAWIGFAVASWSLAGLAFVVYTAANLAPRAHTNHQWYLEKFGEEYPKERKALVPFVW